MVRDSTFRPRIPFRSNAATFVRRFFTRANRVSQTGHQRTNEEVFFTAAESALDQGTRIIDGTAKGRPIGDGTAVAR